MLKKMSTALAAGLGLFCVLCLPAVSHAQTVYGSLFGTVTDNTGAAIPGATVTVTDEAKGTVVVVQSGASGDYSVEHLVPDLYDIKITFTGFQATETKGIQVNADTSAKFDVKLIIGDAAAQTVEVNADTVPVLKTDRADVATEITGQEVGALPITGRNFTNLQLLLPGAQTLSWSHAADENPQGSAQIQVDGQAFGGVAFELDGTDNQDAILGIIVINPPLDAVSEIKIATQNFDAEFGKAVSSVMTSQTKSGSNAFHGSAFDYRESNAQLAKNPYTQYPAFGTIARSPVPAGRRSQFGGSFGGAIIKDKLFFFADYQGLRQVAGVSTTTTIPTARLTNTCLGSEAVNAASQAAGAPAQGCDFSEYTNAGGSGNGIAYQKNGAAYPGNVIPLAQISPQFLAILKGLQPFANNATTPTGGGSLTGIGSNYTTSGNGPFNNNQWDERMDYTLSEKMHIFERFSRFTSSLDGDQIFQSAGLGGPGVGYNNYGGVSKGANDSLAAGFDYTLSNNLLTDFRVGYFRYNIGDSKADQTVPGATNLGLPGLNTTDPSTGGLPDFNVGAPGSAGNNFGDGLNVSRCNCPLIEREDQFQIVNNWTKIIRTHSIKVGGDLRYARNLRVPSDANRTGILGITDGPTSNPALSNSGGNGWASFALGQVSNFQRYVSASTNAKEFQKRDFFYAQDTWRATPNLTLNLGLRYEVYFPESVNGKGNGALMDYNNYTGDGYLRVAGYGNIGSNMGWNKAAYPFNPRIGVAYQLDPKTVIRSGYGKSFDIGVFGSMFGHVVTQNLPVLANQSLSAPGAATNYAFCLGADTPGCTQSGASVAGQPAGGGPAANVFPSVPSNGLLPAPGFNVNIKARPNSLRMPTVDAWNLSIQRAITPTLSITAAYVGNKGTHNLSAGDGNNTSPDEAALVLPAQYSVTGTPLHWDSTANGIAADGGTNNSTNLTRYWGGTLAACQQASYIAAATAAGVALPRPGAWGYANGNISYYGNDQNNHFNALQISMAKQYTKGLSLNANYAWQKGYDYASGFHTWDPHTGYGRNNDIREQQLTLYGMYDLPFGRKGMFLTSAPGWADQLIGGWQLSPVLNWASGEPFTLTYGECNISVGGTSAPCYPNGKAAFLKTHLTSLTPETHQRTFYQSVVPDGAANLCAAGGYQGFTCPGLDQVGNAGRNNAFGPHFFNTDLAIQKYFPIHESLSVQFRMDAYNAFNIVSAGNPNGGTEGGTSSIETTGIINSGSGSGQYPGYAPGAQPRQLQFSLRVQF